VAVWVTVVQRRELFDYIALRLRCPFGVCSSFKFGAARRRLSIDRVALRLVLQFVLEQVQCIGGRKPHLLDLCG
jgi:hypothetical protein